MNRRKEKVIFLGNSIVNGFPHKRSQCFVSLFREKTGHEVINKGVNGNITSQNLIRFDSDVIQHSPDRLYFLSGTNDFVTKAYSPVETLEYLKQIVDLSIQKDIKPILMTPLMVHAEMAQRLWFPDVDYYGVAEKLALLKDLMLDHGKEYGITVLDTQSMFLKLYSEENKEEYLVDGIHPTVLGHRAIADFLIGKDKGNQ